MHITRYLQLSCSRPRPAPLQPRNGNYWIGVQDFIVPDVESHTYGVCAGAVGRQADRGQAGISSAPLDLFVDRDKDELDPDHIPIRWDVHLGTDGEFWQGARTHLGWTADVNTRMNTVSSIEREMTALPAIVAWYDGNHRAAVAEGRRRMVLSRDRRRRAENPWLRSQ